MAKVKVHTAKKPKLVTVKLKMSKADRKTIRRAAKSQNTPFKEFILEAAHTDAVIQLMPEMQQK